MPTSSSSGPRPCNFIPDATSGATVVALVQVGDNAAGGAPEYSLGAGGTNGQGHGVWDSTLADGLDSGWQDVELTVEGGSGGCSASLTVSVGGAWGTVTEIGPGYDYISEVQVKAAVSAAGCKLSWRGLSVRFYRSGDTDPNEGEIPDDICNPSASTLGAAEPASDKQTLRVRPAGDNNVKVVVRAQVRLQSTGTSLPAASAIAGSIHVRTATAS